MEWSCDRQDRRREYAFFLSPNLAAGWLTNADAIIYGNIVYSIGSIVIATAAQIRSYKTMIGGRVISTFGDVATQVAQYKMFSSWFPPNNGFGSTLGLQLGLGKIGSFVGKATANVIAKVRAAILLSFPPNDGRTLVILPGPSGSPYSSTSSQTS